MALISLKAGQNITATHDLGVVFDHKAELYRYENIARMTDVIQSNLKKTKNNIEEILESEMYLLDIYDFLAMKGANVVEEKQNIAFNEAKQLFEKINFKTKEAELMHKKAIDAEADLAKFVIQDSREISMRITTKYKTEKQDLEVIKYFKRFAESQARRNKEIKKDIRKLKDMVSIVRRKIADYRDYLARNKIMQPSSAI